MKNLRYIVIALVLLLATTLNSYAGNPERVGQASASQLLINPWARSTGLNGINLMSSLGIESTFNNPAGIARVENTELMFSYTRFIADIGVNAFGIAQSLNNSGVIALSFVSFGVGDLTRTTVQFPDGELGTYTPTILNAGISYAATFRDQLFVGSSIKMVHESISNVAATTLCFDAGIQYFIGENDEFKLGVSIKNLGFKMAHSGDGLTKGRQTLPGNNTSGNQVALVSESFELPAQLAIGISYDFQLSEDHKLTPMGTFISNSFSYDNIGIGLEYKFKNYLVARASYLYEKDIFSSEDTKTVLGGLAAGLTLELPYKSGKDAEGNAKMSSFGIDYSYRMTSVMPDIHSIGVRINL